MAGVNGRCRQAVSMGGVGDADADGDVAGEDDGDVAGEEQSATVDITNISAIETGPARVVCASAAPTEAQTIDAGR
jgi:hypothetical protein